MATTRKAGKEKRSASPSASAVVDASHGKPSSRASSMSSSPDRDRPHQFSSRPVPNYLKPTLSSRKSSPSTAQTAAPSTGRHLARVKSMEKPPAPSPPPQGPRMQASNSLKERATAKTLSPSSKSASYSKLVSEKTGKPHKSLKVNTTTAAYRGKTGPSSSSCLKKKETSSATSSITTSPTASSQDATEALESQVEPDVRPTDKMATEEEPLVGEEQKEPFDVVAATDDLVHEQILSPEKISKEEDGSGSNIAGVEETHETTDAARELEVVGAEVAPTAQVSANEEEQQHGVEPAVEAQKVKLETETPNPKKEEAGSRDGGEGEVKIAAPKQQEVKGKKEGVDYNDVIEETASKLVEKKKNKVLALAGAFETVISLQKPMAAAQGHQQQDAINGEPSESNELSRSSEPDKGVVAHT